MLTVQPRPWPAEFDQPWMWLGASRFRLHARSTPIHRVFYELLIGPTDTLILHPVLPNDVNPLHVRVKPSIRRDAIIADLAEYLEELDEINLPSLLEDYTEAQIRAAAAISKRDISWPTSKTSL